MNEILKKMDQFFTEKVKTFGPNHKGLDWKSEESIILRFEEIVKTIRSETPYTLLDYGCGFGNFIPFLQARQHGQWTYTGFDISQEMLGHARRLHGQHGRFLSELPEGETFDFVIGSGLFNLKLNTPTADWEQHMLSTIDHLDSLSTRGFGFNVLTSWSDADKMRGDLYYANPAELFDHCKRRYSKNVALLHDYGMYEFTIIVRKS